MKLTKHGLPKYAQKTFSIILALMLIVSTFPFITSKAASGDVTGNASFRVIAYDTSARVEVPYITGVTNYKVYVSTVNNANLTALNSNVTKRAVLNSSSYTPTVYAVNGDKDVITPANTIAISANTIYYFYLVTNDNTLQSTYEVRTKTTATSYWTSTGNYDTSWYDGGAGPFNINTSKQLAGLAFLVNSGTNFSDKTIKLTASLDMSAYLWTPIGTATNNYTPLNSFRGTFDGGNNVIKGLHINNGSSSFQGLFGFNDKGVIKNIGLVDGYVKGGSYTGGVAGENNAGTITNCYNTSTVIGTYATGGVTGFNQLNGANATVTNCYNTGSVTGTTDVGGIVGANIENGSMYYGSIIDCYNIGSVNGTSNAVGGIVGYSRQDGRIINCTNSGSVSTTSDQAGGIAGLNWGILTNCYNIGSVSGANDVGGIAGKSDRNPISNCYNTGAVTATGSDAGGCVGWAVSSTISSYYNTGIVTAGSIVGGVVGKNEGATVTNTYYLTGTAANGIGTGTGSAVAKTSDAVIALTGTLGASWVSAPTTYATDGIFSSTNKVNNGYPVLRSFGYTDGATGDGFSPDITINASTGVITVGTTYGDGTSGSPYIIRNAYQLDLARNYYSNSAIVFQLATDVDISPTQYNRIQDSTGSWKQLGTYSNAFAPTFDGNGFSVSGIYISNSSSYASLFGYSSGTLKNVGVSCGYIDGYMYTAGVAGFNDGDVMYCYNSATICGNSGSTAGVIANGTATNCYNTGSVSSTTVSTGGVIGYGTAQNCYNLGMVTSPGDYLGGVVGRGNATGCYNTGLVCGTGKAIGGVTGNGDATNCYNTGMVTSTGATGELVGGITGMGSVANSYNTGAVTATGASSRYVGGIGGQNSGTINNCYNTGKIKGVNVIGGVVGLANTGTVSNCYNTGVITGYSNIGGITGQINAGTLSYCYSTGSVTSTVIYKGGVVGYKNGGTISNNYYSNCDYGGSSSQEAGATPFAAFSNGPVTVGGTKTMTEQSGLNSNSGWKTALGANFSIAFSAYTASPGGYTSITGTSIQGTAVGDTSINGTITISQNELTSSGFTGQTKQILVPISFTLIINQATPTIYVSSIESPTTIGVQVTLTATLYNGYNPTGTVTFKNNGSVIGTTNTITSGVASINYTPTTTASLSITADYSGDANHAAPATSSAATATVSKKVPNLTIPTATPVTPQTYPVSSVTLSSTLSNYYGTLSGKTITFYDGATSIGTGTTDGSGLATFIWNNPGASTHSVTSNFAADTNNTGATSSAISYTINKGTQTSLIIGGVPSSVTYGDSTFMLTRSGGSGSGIFTYVSSDTNILTVNTSGVVTIKGAGSATITVTKASDSNYNSTSKDVFITVAQKAFDVTITPNDKAYDRSTAATVNSISYPGRVGSDDVSITGGTLAFDDNTAADGKTVTANGYILSGTKATNYTLGTITVSTANITKVTLTVTGIAVNDKIYDGTTSAAFSGAPALSGVIPGDTVSLAVGTPTFESKEYSASSIPVSFSSFGIGGDDAGNYILTQPSSVSASISKRELNVSVNPVTILCGQAIPTLTVVVDPNDFVTGETEDNVVGFAKPNASQVYGSTATPVTNAPMAVTYSGGNATNNYTFSYSGSTLLTITSIINAAAPVFTSNLSGETTYTKGDAAAALSVHATTTDTGSITYQWYVNDHNNTNGIAIDGGITASHTPKTDNTGLFYYYVKATNTNNTVNGNQTSVTTSGIYKVVVNNLEVLPPSVSEGMPSTSMQDDSDKVKDAVLTEDDKDKLAEGSDISIYLKVEKTDAPQADQSLLLMALDGKTMGQYLDISLIKNIDGTESKITQTNSPIRIVISIPEDLRGSGREFSIVRVHDGVAATLMDLDTDPNTITIESDCFSTYAIAYFDVVSAPATGDHSQQIPLMILGLASITAVLCLCKKRRCKARYEIK